MEIRPLVSEDYVVVDEEDTLSQLIGQLKAFEKRTALVFRKDKFLGLIEKNKLLKSRIDPSSCKVKNFIQKSPIINENSDLIETAYLMYQSNLEYVPVESNKKIIGILNALDLIKLALELPDLKKSKVKDIKLVKPSKLNKDDPMVTAIDVMYTEKVDHLPVFDQGKMYGILSFRDILRKYMNWSPKRDGSIKFNKMISTKSARVEQQKTEMLPVSNFSTNDNLLITSLDTALPVAISVMLENRSSDLLVMERENFLGVLTLKSMLRKIGSLKVPKNYNIQFIGLNQAKLQDYQKYNIQKIAGNEAFKLQRKINSKMNLVVHIKEYDKAGAKQKYSVHLRVEFPGKILTSSQDDWDIETALRKTFDNAKNEIKKRFHGDTTGDRIYE